MRYKILIFLILNCLGLTSVSAQVNQASQTMDDTKLVFNGIVISRDIVDDIQKEAHKPYERMKFYQWKDSIIDTTNYGHTDSTFHGIVFRDVKVEVAKGIFSKYLNKIVKEGNYIYLTHTRFDTSGKPLKFDVAIIEAEDQFAAVKRAGTSSLNYDIKNGAIITKLKKWDDEAGLLITVIDINRVEAIMQKKPKNLKKLVSEISEFSPDVVDKCYGTIEKMMKDYEERKYLWLWWD